MEETTVERFGAFLNRTALCGTFAAEKCDLRTCRSKQTHSGTLGNIPHVFDGSFDWYERRMQKRRSRMRRTSVGRRIELSSRDIELFKLLTRYRYLRSTYLHAFVGGASETRFKERLGDLFHEGYLDRPAQQWMFADARFAPVVYEIGKGAFEALRASGEADGCGWQVAAAAGRQFLHAMMICEALASIELGTRNVEGSRFIGWSETLARAPDATRAASKPSHLPLVSGRSVVPDAVFGLEYNVAGKKTYRFFALEADRGTMPVERSSPVQTSYLGKLAAYGEILAHQVYRTSWGVPNLLVLTLTTSEARKSAIIAKLGTASAALLFKAARPSTLASPLTVLLSEPWERVGHVPMSIGESF